MLTQEAKVRAQIETASIGLPKGVSDSSRQEVHTRPSEMLQQMSSS